MDNLLRRFKWKEKENPNLAPLKSIFKILWNLNKVKNVEKYMPWNAYEIFGYSQPFIKASFAWIKVPSY